MKSFILVFTVFGVCSEVVSQSRQQAADGNENKNLRILLNDLKNVEWPLYDALERTLGDDRDGIEGKLLYKHDTVMGPGPRENRRNNPVDANVLRDIDETIANFEFIGYDQQFDFFVPKYARRLPMVNKNVQLIPVKSQSEPKIDKEDASNLYISISANSHYALLPFENVTAKPRKRLTSAIAEYEGGDIYFLTPYKIGKTQKFYISFFYEVNYGQRTPFVYTWMPFIDRSNNVLYSIQIFVTNPVRYIDLRDRMLAVNPKLNTLGVTPEDPLSLYGEERSHELPLYRSRQQDAIPCTNPTVELSESPPGVERKEVVNLKITMVEENEITYAELPLLFKSPQHVEGAAMMASARPSKPKSKEEKVEDGQSDVKRKIGVTNDHLEFFTTPFAPSTKSLEHTEGKIERLFSTYFALIYGPDKYGRHFVWFPFQDKRTLKEYFMQVWVSRTFKFATKWTNEHYIARYGFFELPEGAQMRFEATKTYSATGRGVKDQRELFYRSELFILALAFIPATCSNNVINNKWVRREACLAGGWAIHGMWSTMKEEALVSHKQYCQSDKDRRPEQEKIHNKEVVNSNYRKRAILTLARMTEEEWLDYVWCKHGYFWHDAKNQKRFNITTYFDFAYALYEKVNFEERLRAAGITASDSILYPMQNWTKVIGQFKKSVYAAYYSEYGVVGAVRQVLFCFNSEKTPVICPVFSGAKLTQEEEQKAEDINYLFFPTKYSQFAYLVLVLQYNMYSGYFDILRILPSNNNHGLNTHLFNRRKHHRDALMEEVYTHGDIRKGFLKARKEWNVYRRDVELRGPNWYDGRMKHAVQMMTKMKSIVRVRHYFELGSEAYGIVDAGRWIDGSVKKGLLITKTQLLQRITKQGSFSKRVVMLCNKNQKTNRYSLNEIRVCFTPTKPLQVTDCTDLDDPLKESVVAKKLQYDLLHVCPDKFWLPIPGK